MPSLFFQHVPPVRQPTVQIATLFGAIPSIISVDAVGQLEFSTTLKTDSTGVIEWQSAFAANTPSIAEWRSEFTANTIGVSEWQSTSFVDANSTIEFGFTQFCASGGGLEFRSSPVFDNSASFDVSLSVLSGSQAPVEWLNATGLLIDATDAIEWRATLSADTAAPLEWRAGLSADMAPSAEWLLSFLSSRDTVIPVEWLSSTAIQVDAVGLTSHDATIISDFGTTNPWASEFSDERGPPTTGFDASYSATIIRDFATDIDGRATFSTDTSGLAERLAGVLASADTSVDENASAAFYGILAAESLSTTRADVPTVAEWRSIWLSDATIPAEWRAAIAADPALPTEWRATIKPVDAMIPVSWGATIIPPDAAIPTDAVATTALDGEMPIGWSAVLAPVDVGFPFGIAMSVALDSNISDTPYAAFYRDDDIGVNWTGPIGVILNADAPLEWRSGQFRDDTVLTSYGAVTTHDDIIPTTWAASSLQDNSTPVEVLALATSDIIAPMPWTSISIAAATIPVTWSTTATIDVNMPVSGLWTRQRDIVAPTEPDSIATISNPFYTEWGGAAGIIANATAGIEFQSSAFSGYPIAALWTMVDQVDVVGNVNWTTGVVSAGSVMPLVWNISTSASLEEAVSWTAPAVLDIPISTEYNGITDVVLGAATVPIEFLRAALINVEDYVDWSFTWPPRTVKGSAVEDRSSTLRAASEGSGPKGAILSVPDAPKSEPSLEGSGTKGSALER